MRFALPKMLCDPQAESDTISGASETIPEASLVIYPRENCIEVASEVWFEIRKIDATIRELASVHDFC